jgi:uncharacterized protein YjiS (DUF1127 family)
MNTFSTTLAPHGRTGTAAMDPVTGALRSVQNTVGQWRLRARTRRHLRELDRRLLSDVGLTQEAAKREASKPFWQQ